MALSQWLAWLYFVGGVGYDLALLHFEGLHAPIPSIVCTLISRILATFLAIWYLWFMIPEVLVCFRFRCFTVVVQKDSIRAKRKPWKDYGRNW
jgi:hypothetical protein